MAESFVLPGKRKKADANPSIVEVPSESGVPQGVDYQINFGLAFTSDFLLNCTDLDLGRRLGHADTNVMPSLTFGVRF